MDSLTHIALGAVIGQAYAGKSEGRKAMALGAIAQSIPDIDIVASFWLSPADDLLVHRGFTHSILFGIIISLLLGMAVTRWGRSALSMKSWTLFFLLEIATHLFLDGLNNYGIGWFEPFSHKRFALNVIYVADPMFTIWSLIGCIVMFALGGDHPWKKYWVRFSLILSSLYLIYGVYNKVTINSQVRADLKEQHVEFSRLLTTPAPFNTWLWFYAAETDSGYYTGYASVFDKATQDLNFFPRQSFLSGKVDDQESLKKLLRFSQGYFTLETHHDTVVFNDLRFGQVAGWSDPRARFVFHYYVNHPEANLLVVQRGRFEHWNRETIEEFLRRIAGD